MPRPERVTTATAVIVERTCMPAKFLRPLLSHRFCPRGPAHAHLAMQACASPGQRDGTRAYPRRMSSRSPADLSAWGAPLQPRGTALLTDPLLNKGTAFTERERDALGLRGLLPPRVFTLDEQATRSLASVRRKPDALEKYIYLTNLQNRNEILFYRLVMDNIEEMVPLIYTPTVGQACLEYGAIFRRPRGLFLTLRDKGRIAEVLRHWPAAGRPSHRRHRRRAHPRARGSRRAGHGHSGRQALALHGVRRRAPVVHAADHDRRRHRQPGTARRTGLHRPQAEARAWRGVRRVHRGVRRAAVATVFPKALLQWEDFGNTNAFRLLGGTASGCPASTTTSRARPPWRWPA